MTFNFLIAPGFSPERFAGWHMLNTLLQRRSGIKLHLLTRPARWNNPACLPGATLTWSTPTRSTPST